MTNEKFDALFGGQGAQARRAADPAPHGPRGLGAGRHRRDRAAAGALGAARRPARKNLCLAGGVALNCVANGKLLRENLFDDIWVQPAAGDAGGAVGAASPPITAISARRASSTAISTAWRAPISARNIPTTRSPQRLTAAGARFTRSTREQMIEQTAQALADEKAVGWMQGRMEFGPRSLGARSILGDRAFALDAEDAEPQGQVSRVLPALRAGGAARGCRRVFRHQDRQPLHADGGAGERGPPPRHDRGRGGAVRHRQAERAALGHSGGDPCRLLGAHPDRAQGDQPGLPRSSRVVQGARPAARCW